MLPLCSSQACELLALSTCCPAQPTPGLAPASPPPQVTLTAALQRATAAPAVAMGYLSVVWGLIADVLIFKGEREEGRMKTTCGLLLRAHFCLLPAGCLIPAT